jgi:multiple sugar transport system permease protein
MRRNVPGRVGIYAAAVLLVAYVLAPYAWMVSASFKTTNEIQATDIMERGREPTLVPRAPTLDNYRKMNDTVPMLDYLRNSLVIACGTMLATVTLSFLAAYVLSRFRGRATRMYSAALYATQMFPGIAFLIPYVLMLTVFNRAIGVQLKNTYAGLILTYTGFALPFCALMMSGFLASVPRSLDEQAQIDGCGRLATLFRVILPVSTPGIVSVGIYAFVMAWNEMLFGSILMGSDTKGVSLGLMQYITNNAAYWGGMMAACIVTSIPMFLFFAFLQKQIIGGLTSGAVKG